MKKKRQSNLGTTLFLDNPKGKKKKKKKEREEEDKTHKFTNDCTEHPYTQGTDIYPLFKNQR